MLYDAKKRSNLHIQRRINAKMRCYAFSLFTLVRLEFAFMQRYFGVWRRYAFCVITTFLSVAMSDLALLCLYFLSTMNVIGFRSFIVCFSKLKFFVSEGIQQT